MLLQKWSETESKFNIDMLPPTRWVSQDPMEYEIFSLVHTKVIAALNLCWIQSHIFLVSGSFGSRTEGV